MPNFPQEASTPSPAGDDLLAGRAVYDDGTETVYISDTNQVTTQTVLVSGILINSPEDGELPAIATADGGDLPFVSSGTTAPGDLLVPKFSADVAVAGTLMKVLVHAAGDHITAICMVGAADTGTGMCRFIGHPLK